MQKLIDALNASVFTLRTKGKATIKAEVATLTEAGVTCDELDTSSKAAFIESLEDMANELVESETLEALDSLKVEIAHTIEQAGATSFKLGRLLTEAREACENQQEFLEWTDKNFGIKKSWAFKLMAVSKRFEGEPWSSVAVSVLYTLQAQATDEQMLEARKFAEAGKLDVSTVKALLSPSVPVIKQAEPVVTDADKRATASVQAALMDVTPHDVKGVEATPAPVAAKPVPAAEGPDLTRKTDTLELQEQLESALKTISELSQQIAELTRPRLSSGPQMPMLPQFSSKSMYARLGLDAADCPDKGEILEAFKALCKAGYGRSHEAFKLIDEARHNLIHAGEGVEA